MKKIFILVSLCFLFTISAVSQSKKEWEKVQSLNSWNVYKQFITNYPNGKYTELAKQKIALLKEPKVIVKKIESPKTTTIEQVIEKTKVSASDILVKTGRTYTLNDKTISHAQLVNLYKNCPESLKEYKLGKTYRTSGNILTWSGLAYVVVSSQIVRIGRENDYTDWFNYHSSNHIPGKFDESKYPKKLLVNAGIGVGISAIGLICLISAPEHFTKAVNLYNSRHKTTGYRSDLKLDIGLTRNGVGVTCHF